MTSAPLNPEAGSETLRSTQEILDSYQPLEDEVNAARGTVAELKKSRKPSKERVLEVRDELVELRRKVGALQKEARSAKGKVIKEERANLVLLLGDLDDSDPDTDYTTASFEDKPLAIRLQELMGELDVVYQRAEGTLPLENLADSIEGDLDELVVAVEEAGTVTPEHMLTLIQKMRDVLDLVKARPAAGTPETPDVPPANVEPVAPLEDTPTSEEDSDQEDDGETGIKEKVGRWVEKGLEMINMSPTQRLERKMRSSIHRPVKDALKISFDELVEMIDESTPPTDTDLAREREDALIPFLAYVKGLGVISFELTGTAQAMANETAFKRKAQDLEKEFNEEDEDGRKKALANLKIWVEKNKARIFALTEVIGTEEPATESAPEPDVSQEDVATDEASDKKVESAPEPPKAPESGEGDVKKKLKAVYEEARTLVPESLDEDAKMNMLATAEQSRARVLGVAFNRFNNLLSGTASKDEVEGFNPNDATAVEQMALLLVASEVPKLYDGIKPPPAQKKEDIKALLQKIAA
ncbi:hypothetical protein H3C66_00155 [Patescibacteria group bacterium]|nr:hypothetical protein [Patescibacteria group bacterium]